jgi:CheY-like chemotaxis protein
MIRSLRILILDDDPAMRALFSIAFRNLPLQLRMAQNETEAQRFLDDEPLDLFLVDFCLGGKNGLEVAETVLRCAEKKIPILIVSAETSGAMKEYVNSGRCLGHLSKPISLSTFGADVLSYLGISNDGTPRLASQDMVSVRSGSLGSAFLETALAKARDLSSLGDSDLLKDGLLTEAAHRWAGASGIDCLPEVETEARELERLARTRDSEQIPVIRRLLTRIMGKFESATASLVFSERD